MGNKESNEKDIISSSKYITNNNEVMESLGEFMIGTDVESKETYLILVTSYQIPN